VPNLIQNEALKMENLHTQSQTFDSDVASSDVFGSSASCDDTKAPQQVLCIFFKKYYNKFHKYK